MLIHNKQVVIHLMSFMFFLNHNSLIFCNRNRCESNEILKFKLTCLKEISNLIYL